MKVSVLSPEALSHLQKKVYDHYHAFPRPLPWRQTHDPYAILVSEVMLQQTTVDRVVPKYLAFLDRFPDVETLASADLHEVMTLWQGLGYNRRGAALKRTAEAIAKHHGGVVPRDPEELRKLPGIGPYTAAAVAIFAYGASLSLIETNIRTVFIHEFFPSREKIRDTEIAPLVEAAIDHSNSREWYYALMDYGVMLKKTMTNPSRRSAHHSRQTPFAGSSRERRSRILRSILSNPGCTIDRLAADQDMDLETVISLVEKLEKDHLVVRKEGRLYV